MRLYNTYYLCKLYLPHIANVEFQEIYQGTDIVGYNITNWSVCMEALKHLKNIECLKSLASAAYNSINVFERDKEIPNVSTRVKDDFCIALLNLEIAVETLIKLYESLEIKESKGGIDVKIPKCDSLKEYMYYLKEIDFIFNQCPYLLDAEEEIRFNAVDVGSQWLSFVILSAGTFGILNNLAKLVDKAIAIKSHLLTLKQQEEMLATISMRNEVMKETIDVFKKMKKITIDKYVEELEGEIGELNDGEERGKVEKTLEKLVVLIDKGVEIYSSIETPNEVKALFPMNEDNPILPDNIVKLLEQKEKTEE